MAKKYSPSGYQIIDLGAQDLSSTVTINKGENADADVLIDLYNIGKLHNKPILLHLNDTDESYNVTGFAISRDQVLILHLNDLDYTVAIYDGKIEIEKTAL